MRSIFFLFLVVIFSCSNRIYKETPVPRPTLAKENLYTVTKIDSMNNFYIIYLKNDNNKYKVVSEKEINSKNCHKLKEGEEVFLNLKSFYEKKFKFGDREMTTSLMVDCFSFGENTTICREEANDIYDLNYAENLEGLCIKGNY